MVWAGISAQGKTDLHIIENSTLTAVRYVNEILDVHVRTYASTVGPEFLIIDDTPVHTEHTSQTMEGDRCQNTRHVMCSF
jgi:hypothetical protein